MRFLVARFVTLVAFLAVYSTLGSYLSLDLVNYVPSTVLRGGASLESPAASENSEAESLQTAPVSSSASSDTENCVPGEQQVPEQVQNTNEERITSNNITTDDNTLGGNSSDPRASSDLDVEEEAFSSIVFKASQKLKQRNKIWDTFKTRNSQSSNSTAAKKLRFLDRIALVSNALLKSEHDALIETSNKYESDMDQVTPQSDLTRPGRHISVVTTAALPWMTGTAVNPLLRAAHLCRKTKQINLNHTNSTHKQQQWVTLVVPWLELEEDQLELYGPDHVFADEKQQEEYIRDWLRVEAAMEDVADPDTGLAIMFYPARYHSGLKSIFAMGDVCSLIPHRDVCVLEEPEHLNWYRAPGQGWTTKFNYVVGIVHTNYKEYASAHYSGIWTAPAIAALSSAMVRAYCHKVIKLSDVLQTFAPEKEETSNVHGVRSDFLKEGERRGMETVALDQEADDSNDDVTRVYFIGKILWAKGLDLMMELQSYYRQCTGDYFAIDVYGSGPELKDITRAYHGRKQYQTARDNGEKRSAKRVRRRKGDSRIRILGTAIPFSADSSASSLFSEDDEDAVSTDSEEDRDSDSSDSDDGTTAYSFDTQQALDYLQIKAREKLEKIKETIKLTTESLEFDLPKSFGELRREPIPATFPGRVDHASLKEQHKIFVNPSITEVLCTTTAEALAMGKFAIVPAHPSNAFFLKFPNCLAYRNKWEFAANLKWALAHEPEPLTPELAYEFTWEAATERFIKASAITWREATEREKLGTTKLDERIAYFHNELGKGVRGDTLRKVLGAGPASHQHRYQLEREAEQSEIFAEGESEEEDGGEDDEEGLPGKLHRSWLAEAIRATAINGLPTTVIG